MEEVEDDIFDETDETEEKAETGKRRKGESQEPTITRAKLPRNGEIIGIIEQRLGGNKMMVDCSDGKKRNCRVPGRLKRALWLREGDVVLIELWEFDKDKGDIIFKYPNSQITWLQKNGFLKEEKSRF